MVVVITMLCLMLIAYFVFFDHSFSQLLLKSESAIEIVQGGNRVQKSALVRHSVKATPRLDYELQHGRLSISQNAQVDNENNALAAPKLSSKFLTPESSLVRDNKLTKIIPEEAADSSAFANTSKQTFYAVSLVDGNVEKGHSENEKADVVSVPSEQINKKQETKTLLVVNDMKSKKQIHWEEEEAVVQKRERPKICYVPLSWLFSSDCRAFAKYAPLFDVDSPEFMKYW
jgi:hypothetical protein